MADSSGASKDHQPVRDLARWLLLAPIAFVLLFGCGQLALLGVAYPPAPDTRSNLRADYRPWPNAVIAAVNPAIIDDIRRDDHINSTVVAQPFWPTATPGPHQPTPTPRPTLIAERPSATATGAATREPSSPTVISAAPTSTQRPTSAATRQQRPTLTLTSVPTNLPTATDTLTPLPTHRPTRTPPPIETATFTPTPIDTTVPPIHTATSTTTPTSTPTATPSPTATFTPVPIDTPTPTATATPTATPTSTGTSTPTPTDTITPTPTATWELCHGNIPPGEPDIGSPDGTYATVACETYLNIDLDGYAASHITSHTGYDFVYFEQEALQPPCYGICLDWVRVEVSADAVNWVTAFDWGDDIPDDNTNVASYSAGGEDDNEPIPSASLYCDNGYCSGIAIDVDALGAVPPGGYRYIRFWSPLNPNNDGSEVDAVLIFP